MEWIYILLASTGELILVWGIKRRPVVMAITYTIGLLVALVFLSMALDHLESSTVYPVWVSIGAIGSYLIGWRVYGERLNRKQVAFIGLLVFSVILMIATGS